MQLFELDAHLDAELRVEIGKRFVEQEYLRVAHDGAAERDTLALPAGKLPRLARQVIANAKDIGRVMDALFDLRAVDLPHFQAERHVVEDTHMRIERVVLKHHGDVAIHRRQLVHDNVADQDLARGDRFEAGHHA